MNILVIGCDQVGASLVRDLERIGHDISIIEKDSEQLKRLDAFDDYTFSGNALVGDPTDPDVLRQGGIEVVSCPTCGRTRIDLIGLANQVETMVSEFPLDIKVAVMGCVVNGPGEAKEADIGIAGGVGEGLIIKHGEIYKKVPEAELLPALRYELEHWSED